MTAQPKAHTHTAGPAWDIAHLFPLQGAWSEGDYLALTNQTSRLVELSEGCVEVLAMPTRSHQRIVLFLYRLLFHVLELPGLASVFVAPLRVRLWQGKIREPDLVVMLAANRDREREDCFEGADLVIEVVSPDDPARDLVTKRDEYARAGIAEYWIVEPLAQQISVLRLEEQRYHEHARGTRGDTVDSALLPHLRVDVSVLDAAQH